MSTELSETLNKIAKQIGVAVDFTSKNAAPYIKELTHRYVIYKQIENTFGILVCIVAFLASTWGIVDVLKNKHSDSKRNDLYYDRYGMNGTGITIIAVCAIVGSTALIVLTVLVPELIQVSFCPEISIIKELTK